MATSGSTNFSVNRNELITLAYQEIGALESGESPTNDEYSEASKRLNMMLKLWMNDGLKLWLTKEVIMIPVKGQEGYTFGTDHAALTMEKTELAAAGSTSDTTLTVDSTTGMAASDNIGIVTDDGTIHWTTISSVTNSTTVVIASGLDSAAAIDNHVYHYTTKQGRPHQLLSMYRREYDTRVDVPMSVVSRNEYYNLSDKDTQGTPVNYYYDPQLDNSVVKVWPTADSTFASNNVFVCEIRKPIDDMDAGTDDFECPPEWYEAILLGLAERLARSNFYPIRNHQQLKIDAAIAKEMAMTPEGGSLNFQPDD